MRYSGQMRKVILIAHNLRSSHNVGSLLRTAEGMGVETVFLTGYTPYPVSSNDDRLPHIANKVDKMITKTALGAEKTQNWSHEGNIEQTLAQLKAEGYIIAGVEQAKNSIKLPDYEPPDKIALIVGREVEGIEQEIINQCDVLLEIPMFGQKESYNVVQAAAMALYHCRFRK